MKKYALYRLKPVRDDNHPDCNHKKCIHVKPELIMLDDCQGKLNMTIFENRPRTLAVGPS